MMKQIEMVLS